MTPRAIAAARGQKSALRAAEDEGAAAWRSASGRAVDCPYRDDAGEDLLRQAWLRGYYREYPRSNAEWGRVA